MKYDNWRELAVECQESGMSINAWSKKKNIPGTTCRQWLKRFNKESQPVKANTNQNSDLAVWGKIDLKESREKESILSTANSTSNISLKYRGWCIELKPNFNPSLLKQIMKVVESVC